MPRFPKKPLAELIQLLTICDWAPDGWDVRWVVDPLPMEGMRNDTLGAWIELSMTPSRSRGVDDFPPERVLRPAPIHPDLRHQIARA